MKAMGSNPNMTSHCSRSLFPNKNSQNCPPIGNLSDKMLMVEKVLAEQNCAKRVKQNRNSLSEMDPFNKTLLSRHLLYFCTSKQKNSLIPSEFCQS